MNIIEEKEFSELCALSSRSDDLGVWSPPGREVKSSQPTDAKINMENTPFVAVHDGDERIDSPRTPAKPQTNRGDRHAPLGPSPLLLTRAEVDELYDLLSCLLSCLDELGVPHILVAGSLLGAVRSKSILFNDDDVDIAIIDNTVENEDFQSAQISHYTRMQEYLPNLLQKAASKRNKADKTRSPHRRGVEYSYRKRPWVACDRVKSSAAPRVWIDLFVLRRYESRQDVLNAISYKDNGDLQPDSYINHILSGMGELPTLGVSPSSGSPTSIGQIPSTDCSPTIQYPIYHYDNRKAMELWPREFFTTAELFPIQKTLAFGPLTQVPGPRISVQTLRRFFGSDCFTYYVSIEHNRGKKNQSHTTSWQDGRKMPLTEEQYLPVQHSKRNKRIWSDHTKSTLEHFLLTTEEKELSILKSQTKSPSSLTRTKSFLGSASSPFSTSLNKTSTLVQLRQQSGTLLDLSGSSPLITKGKQQQQYNPQWFGATLRRHTHGSPDVPLFDKEMRHVMEPHIVKARLGREQTLQKDCLKDETNVFPLSISREIRVPYPSLRTERPFLFDVETYPLHQILADTIQVSDLSRIHEHHIQDKRTLLDALLHRDTRRPFHECYDNFVTSFCIPLLHSLAMTENLFNMNKSVRDVSSSAITYRYQAFPCIRVIRPDEFSIGPHCDVAYGHSIGNINFHIPLTPTFGTNALYAESHPGKEDWHPFSCRSIGLGYLFDGARCLHWTMENTTDRTRVSLDFRVAITRTKENSTIVGTIPEEEKKTPEDAHPSPEQMYVDGDDGGAVVDDLLCSAPMLKDQYSEVPGYYDEAIIEASAIARRSFRRADPIVVKRPKPIGVGGIDEENALYDPDKRVGFPFC